MRPVPESLWESSSDQHWCGAQNVIYPRHLKIRLANICYCRIIVCEEQVITAEF